ncbi:hypothetical protein ACHAO5_007881 [Verticillium nonalfalfae]
MAGPYGNNTAASSSSHSPDRTAQPHSNPDDSDELDDLFDDGNDDDRDVLAQDPIRGSLEGPISFKRKQKQGIFSAPARFLSSLAGRPGNDTANSTPRSTTPRPSFMLDGFASTGADEDIREAFNRPAKDASPTDWYHEGPGRRVGYEDMTAIDWIFEYTKERQRLRVLHSSAHGLMGLFRRFADASQVWLILILTGLAVGTVAAGIDVTTDWLGDLKTGYCSSGPEGGAFHLNKAFCCWGYDESSKCAGWIPWAKAFGVASKGGAWIIDNINDNEARKREVLSAAAASGISVAFGSPIGGVLFCLEQISYYFPDKTMWQSFVCAMTAAVMLQALDPFRTEKLVLYEAEVSTEWTDFEIIPYAILGIIGGIYGGLFIKANMAVARWKKRSSWLPGPIVQVIAVALLTALVNFPNFYMQIQSSELVSNLFVECGKHSEDKIGLCKTGAASASTIVLLLFAAILGFLLAAITFGLQLPAGIILPSMAIGALTGRAVGIIMEIWVKNHPKFFAFGSCAPDIPCITPATYAVVGAAATLAGVTRMTVSIVVIMFELTGALTYVLPMMVAVMISKWVGDAFSRRGIYESWIHFNEYPFLDNSDAETAQIPDIPATQVITRIEDLVVLTATGHTIASLTAILDANPHRGFPVISDPREAILLGYISRAELSYNLRSSAQPPRSLPPETEAFFTHQPMADPSATLDLRPWMDQTPITLPSRANLHLVVSYFQKLGLRYVLFADRGVLQGLLTKKDVWYVLNGADETRRTAGTSGRDGTVETGITREDGDGEAEGLLRERSGSEAMSPAHERGPML